MAFQPKSIKVSFQFRDASGSLGSTHGYRALTDTLAAIKTAADALATALLGASDCSLLSYSVAAAYANDAVLPAGGLSRVERKGVIQFATAAGFLSEMSIPGINATLINQAGGLISDAVNLVAVTDAVVNGGWTDNRGADLVRVEKDYETFRATTKGSKTTDTNPAA